MNIDLVKYISPKRFDFMAKYLYIKFRELGTNTPFYYNLYCEHIRTFNNGWEYPGTKTKIEDFIKSFDNLILNIKNNGFDKKYSIPINTSNMIINGAHRLLTCYYHNEIPTFSLKNESAGEYNYNFFINREKYGALPQSGKPPNLKGFMRIEWH